MGTSATNLLKKEMTPYQMLPTLVSSSTSSNKPVDILEKWVDDWEKRPQDERDLEDCIEHFTAANEEYRLTKQGEDTKDILRANTVVTTATDELKALITAAKDAVSQANTQATGKATWVPKKAFGLDGFEYCWTHGVCNHKSNKCRFPNDGHKNEATIFNQLGGKDGITLPGRAGRNNRNRENVNPNNSN
jgi:hypothetical protein